MIDKNPFQITEFKGLNRGSVDPFFKTKNNDQIPFSNAVEGQNLIFTKEGAIRARPGVGIRKSLLFEFDGSGDISLNIVPMQHWKINRLLTVDYVNRWLVLEWDGVNGNLYDIYEDDKILILTISAMKFASVINIFGRLYISPLYDFGLPADDYIYVYDGSGVAPEARQAGGAKPEALTLAVAEAANGSANVTAGLHLAAIAFETDTGFITKPNATWKQVTITVDTGKSIKFTNVDTGPTGTVARHLLVTKTIQNYDNIQENWELFFGFRIPDNTATEGEVILPDTGLVDSADYLLDEYEAIPACAAISVLAGRLLFNGISTDRRIILVSQVANPETISQVEDYIQIFDGMPADIYTGKEFRGLYYIFKESSTYVTNDNGGPPNTWKVDLIDSGMGAAPFGIAEVMANPGGLVLDNLIIANLSGVYGFSGIFSQVPLGRNIQAVFTQDLRRIDNKYSRISIDPVNRIAYLLIGRPIDAPPEDPTDITGGCTLYIGDYYNGVDFDSIKWMKWDPKVTIAMSTLDPGINGIVYTDMDEDEFYDVKVGVYTDNAYTDLIIEVDGVFVGSVSPPAPPPDWLPANCFGWTYSIPDIGVISGTYSLRASGTRLAGAPNDDKDELLLPGPNVINFIIIVGG